MDEVKTGLSRALDTWEAVTNRKWPEGQFIFKQVPAKIGKHIIPNMQSLPKDVKGIFLDLKVEHINYKNQIAKVSIEDGGELIITGWTPELKDVMSLDWIEFKL